MLSFIKAFLMHYPLIAIAVGTAFVCGGGLLATWGWNQMSELQHKSNLITAAVREWKLNEQMTAEATALARRWNTRENAENFSYQPYKASRLNGLISSGLLGGSEKRLIHAAQSYETAIGDFNAYLRIAGRHNPGLFLKPQFIHKPPEKLPSKDQELLADAFQNLIVEHRRLGDALKTQYTELFEKATSLLQ